MSPTRFDPPDYVRRNRQVWNDWAPEYAAPGHREWGSAEPVWGIWGIPEASAGLLPELQGKASLEIGCGTGYVSAWLARRGARPTGLDSSPAQLTTARQFQQEFSLTYPLVHGIAERLPFPDASFDFAISEYGACIWSDPHLWIPEAARVLRPGAELVFLVNGTVLMLCVPDEDGVAANERLLRPYFGMHRFEWPDDPSVEFHLGYGDWIRLLRNNGFEIEELIELRAPLGASTRYPYVTPEWAASWPSEEVWKVRRR